MAQSERSEVGDPLGTHRVVDVTPCLPQSAQRLDNSLPAYSNEIVIQVDVLNIDAASFVQMEQQTDGDEEMIGQLILQNCRERGKQHNAVTGSGGMLMGEVVHLGSRYRGSCRVKPGERVATLVSLTLTPLHLDQIVSIDSKTHQVKVRGHAILFESGILATLPRNLRESVAMAVLDVAGAPAWTDALCKKGQSVVIIGGGGKAGILSAVAARQKVGKMGRVIAIEPFREACDALTKLGVCDEVLQIDATHPVAVQSGIRASTRGKMADIVVNVASVANTEMSSILAAKKRGKIVLFSMASSFSRAALGAEGVGSQATLLIGNGYYPGHDRFALGLLNRNKKLKALFYQRYSK